MALRRTISAPKMKEWLCTTNVNPHASLPPLPVVIDYHGRNRRAHVVRTGDDFEVTDLLRVVVKDAKKTLNVGELLNVFSTIHSPDEVLAFLELCGPFRTSEQRQHVSWAEFQEFQDLIRSVRLGESLRFPKLTSGPVDFERIVDPELYAGKHKNRHGKVVAVLEFHPKTALEAIGTAAFIEQLRSADLAACGLQGCKRIFEKTSDHERQFCCPEHGRQHAKRMARMEQRLLLSRKEKDHAKA